jgi:hypothetical protein
VGECGREEVVNRWTLIITAHVGVRVLSDWARRR